MHQRKETFQSKTVEGASFTLRYMGSTLRNRIELEIVPLRHEMRMNAGEQLSIMPELDGEEEQIKAGLERLSVDEKKQLEFLRAKNIYLSQAVKLAFAIKMLEDFYLPGGGYENASELFDFGPEDFVTEIADKALELWRLDKKLEKNSERPSTSAAAGDGPTNNTTAGNAS